MSAIMYDQSCCLAEVSELTEAKSRYDKDSSHADEDDTICDTCSGEGSSIEELDDGEISVCSWTTDQGDWDLPSSHHVEVRDDAAANMFRSDACVTFVPMFVPMPSAWQMDNYPLTQGVPLAPGEWAALGNKPSQRQWPKPLSFHQKQRQLKQERQLLWQSHKADQLLTNVSGNADRLEVAANEDATKTTLILRNCPTDCGRDILLKVLDAEGFAGLYDFVHVPVEFHSSNVLGYSIVNMVSPSIAQRALKHFQGFDRWPSTESVTAACETAWNSPLQGLAAHVDRYRNSPLMHQSVPEQYRPILLRKGVRAAFPRPTTRVRAPRIRNHW